MDADERGDRGAGGIVRAILLCAATAAVLLAPTGAATQTPCRTPVPHDGSRGDTRTPVPGGSDLRQGPSWASATGQYVGVEHPDGYVFADGGDGGMGVMAGWSSGATQVRVHVLAGPAYGFGNIVCVNASG